MAAAKPVKISGVAWVSISEKAKNRAEDAAEHLGIGSCDVGLGKCQWQGGQRQRHERR